MKRTVFSQSWHNVSNLHPRLLPHVRIYPHTYRGQRWYVLQDTTSGRYHRLTPDSYQLVNGMDGKHTVQALWNKACEAGGESIPTQEEVVQLLMQLHANDLLHCDVTPDSVELFERYTKKKREKWKRWLTQPLSLKFPLYNPDDLLTRWAHYCSWVFSWKGGLLWLVVVIPALLLAGQHWRELTNNLSDQVLSVDNLLVLVLVFPFVKALHELGHGFAAKTWGGSVHEMGVMFLVFAPIPYVDASSSSAFRSKYKRAVVGMAGMLTEVFLAALAMYVWVLAEPGIVRAMAFNTMLIAGISTVIVNGNPLLRFDGYYVLTDLIEMPNLAQRGQKYLTYLSDRYLFGAKELTPPGDSRSEKAWFVGYTILSWFYRVFIFVTIILFIAGKFFILGVLLAIIASIGLFGKPLWKGCKHLAESPTLHRYRSRAIKITIGIVAITVLLLSLAPMPLRTQSEGVVWLPDQALVRAKTDGFLQRWLVEPGTYVSAGSPLLIMENTQTKGELAIAQARVDEIQARYNAEQFSNPVQANVLLQQLDYEKKSLDEVNRRYGNLVIYAKTDGVLTALGSQDMAGRYYQKGDLLGYVINQDQLVARVAVLQDDIGLVRSSLKKTEMRYVDSVYYTYPVTVLREIPSALNELPTAALSPNGGGDIPIDPTDSQGLKTLGRVFFVEVSLPETAVPEHFGSRVYVRFSHHSEPLLSQAFRRVRQLFLSRFNV